MSPNLGMSLVGSEVPDLVAEVPLAFFYFTLNSPNFE